jgi:hypothetical protein
MIIASLHLWILPPSRPIHQTGARLEFLQMLANSKKGSFEIAPLGNFDICFFERFFDGVR